jgi:oxygen-dependent protoporphyrinogen oxidase
MSEKHDVVVIGGGIAGLTAAWRLREHAPLLLEAGPRVGGRIRSERRGDLALSVGAHMFPAPDSVIGRMVTEFGLETLPITGSMLNVHYRGRLVRDRRPELFPLLLPLHLRSRLSFATAGLRVKRSGERYMRIITPRPGDTSATIRLRALRYHGDETFAQFLGPLHHQVFEIFQALANRSAAEPDEIAHSSMAALFGHVWDGGDLGWNMRGGAARLPEALGAALGDAVRLNTRVEQTELDDGLVLIRTDANEELRARTAIIAVPAPVAREFLRGLPRELDDALGRVRFGPLIVMSLLTGEETPMPWDDLYSVLTPDKAFNMLFNHANSLKAVRASKPGSVLMVYAGGDRGRRLLDASDDEIRERFLADIESIFPEIRGRVVETMVQKWPHAAPFAAPGRWRSQELLERGVQGRLMFAGDWMSEFVSMDTAARSALDAAERIAASLSRTTP